MRPWERRLSDLAQALANCHQTYFEPEQFRRNVNTFLTVARTVTFLIQKNLDEIPDGTEWYTSHVRAPWSADPLMRWAVDARNQIEKRGDLELHSEVQARLMFSYLEEEDLEISCPRETMLSANMKRLVRFARRRLPTFASDAAVLRIGRRWVTSSLIERELLAALTNVYENHFSCCTLLAAHLKEVLPGSIPEAGYFHDWRDDARRITYFKLADPRPGRLARKRVARDESFVPPDSLRTFVEEQRTRERVADLSDAVAFFSRLAEINFAEYGSHVPMLHVLDEDWRVVDRSSAMFADQSDKYIYWRGTADRIRRLNAHAIVFTAENWIRAPLDIARPVRTLPVVGEELRMWVLDKSGALETVTWTISRPVKEGPPTLSRVSKNSTTSSPPDPAPNFLIPVARAFGLPPTTLRTHSQQGSPDKSWL